MKKFFFATFIVSFIAFNATAQTSYWSFSWPVSFSLGTTKEYIAKTSFRGIVVDGRFFLKDNLSIGGSWSWEVFNEIKRNLPPRELSYENKIFAHITGTEYRYLNTVPIFFNTHYYFGKKGTTRSFIGASIGTVYVDQRTDIGMQAYQTKIMRFGFQPEIGIFIPFGLSSSGLSLSGKYRYATKAKDAESINMFSIGIGIGTMN